MEENIKVRFFETDENDQETWEDWGKFTETDVHHQYAIGNSINIFGNIKLTFL